MISTLIVDDDFRVAGIHAAYVERIEGFAVCGSARTAEQARRAVAHQRPELILLDLYLPDEHGLALMRRVLAGPGPHPDFVVITAARDTASVGEALRLGAVHYLVKPFAFGRLEERLAAYRSLRRRLAQLTEAGQHDIDALYGLYRPPAPACELPKGLSKVTLDRILDALRGADGDLSASEVAESAGVSRPTAHRYLNRLLDAGRIEMDLNYGSGGRPEHRYRATGKHQTG